MNRYVYYQPNKKDLKDNVGDCSIRALTKAFNKSWLEIFDELIPYARNAQVLPNQKDAYEAYLRANGFEYSPCKKGSRISVSDFAKTCTTGTYILYIRVGYGTHLVTISQGKYYDTWDCGNRILYGYYSRRNVV